MHVFPLQCRQLYRLLGVNCIYVDGGSPVSSDSHHDQLDIAQNLCNNNIIYSLNHDQWSGSLSSLKLGWLAHCRPISLLLANLVINS